MIITKINTCCHACTKYLYKLPFTYDDSILSFLSSFGDNILSPKLGILKINTEEISINGNFGNDEITVKYKKDSESLKNKFKNKLEEYINSKSNN